MIADMSLHFFAYKVASCSFTSEPTKADYGYDLTIFTFDPQGQYENGNIFVQLKATDRLRIDRQTGEIIFRVSARDVLAWEGEPFPVYLVVFDAKGEKAYAVHLQRYFADKGIAGVGLTAQSAQIRLSPIEVEKSMIEEWRDEKNRALNRIGAATYVRAD